ncbi:Rv1733c family protein [Streptomyces tagetis]|uniref:Proline rich protein membrane protein n=1 Tax=Streptomyces tagetis TaxID=2820809 RepID=A0A940XE01_9ACTN|nr:hypothetical protein [Streptomyces sp. RG38]MBQ0825422.1 hypothetical protein [Streptomyces sp. RG38]
MAGDTSHAPPPPDRRGDRPHPLLWRWRRNPLRRPSDRLQAWIALGLALAVLVAAPLAASAAGDAAHRHYRGTAEHQERTRAHVPAVLVHDTPRHPEPGSPEARESRYPVTVRFTGPDGETRTGTAEVEPGLTAGNTVHVWTDARGTITEPPLGAGEIRSRAMGWAILALLAVVLSGLAAYGIGGRMLHRRNLAGWDTDWAATEPRWSRFP